MNRLIIVISVLFINSLIQFSDAQIPKTGLIGVWKFTGNAKDSSGKNNHGTVNGAVLTKDRFEKNNRAYKFGGVDNISLGCNNSLLSPPALSLAVWFKMPSDNDGDRRTLFRNRTYGYTIWTLNDSIFMDVHDGPTVKVVRSKSRKKYNDDKWHHVVMTMDKKALKTYIDGLLIDSLYTGFDNYYSNKCVAIGADDNSSTLAFMGDLDDICLYDRVINRKQVDSLFNDGKSQNTLTVFEKEERSGNDGFFYPNPASDIIEFKQEVTDAIIYDQTGKLINKLNTSNSCFIGKIDVKSLDKGIYILLLKIGNKWESTKFIKI